MKKAVPMVLSESNFKQIFAFETGIPGLQSCCITLPFSASVRYLPAGIKKNVPIWRSLSLQRSSVQKYAKYGRSGSWHR